MIREASMINAFVLLSISLGSVLSIHGSDVKLLMGIVQESRCLCGQVKIEGAKDDDRGIEGVLVEELSSDLRQVVRSTYTGKNGSFEFPKASSSDIHYICVSHDLFQTMCYKVKLSKKAKGELTLGIGLK